MNGGDSGQLDRARHLMMAALDGEIGPGERRELERLVDGDAALRAEWERLRRLKEVTGAMTLKRPPDEVWRTYWVSVYNRFERGIGWVLLSVGAVVLITWGLWEMVNDLIANTKLPLFGKVSILAVIAGGAVLFVSVLREKLFTRSRDPYKEIER